MKLRNYEASEWRTFGMMKLRINADPPPLHLINFEHPMLCRPCHARPVFLEDLVSTHAAITLYVLSYIRIIYFMDHKHVSAIKSVLFGGTCKPRKGLCAAGIEIPLFQAPSSASAAPRDPLFSIFSSTRSPCPFLIKNLKISQFSVQNT